MAIETSTSGAQMPDVTAGEPFEGHRRFIFQSLAVYRSMSFTMGAGLVFGLTETDEISVPFVTIVGVVGLYNILRVASRFDPTKHNAAVQWIAATIDLSLGIVLVLASAALDSPFLLYSLSAILTVSLLMDMRGALFTALVAALSISGAHIAAGLDLSEYPWVLEGNYLAFSLMYSAVCLLIAYLPSLANLNWQRRLRAESLGTERRRLRREVHDNVAQTLAFLSLKVRRAEERSSEPRSVLTAEDVREIGGAVERAYLAVRDYLDGTEEGEPDVTLTRGLATLTDEWKRDTGLPVKVSAVGLEQDPPPRVRYHLLQVVREALANVAKHAYATGVWVDLEFGSKVLTLRVRDNGRGFPSSGPHGHGLGIMKERTTMAGASLNINSAPGEGTEVVVAYLS